MGTWYNSKINKGDGNIHINVICQENFEEIKNIIEPDIYE